MIELRDYQKSIAKTALFYNTLIVLPTGLGKTHIAFYIMQRYRTGLFLAPTKPLVIQQAEVFKQYKNDLEIATGDSKREYKSSYIFATPQTIVNDLDILPKDRFDIIIFDEAHRAVGDYAYVKISKYFEPKRILGLTASPGSDLEKIREIITNLKIQKIEYRTEDDPDIVKYIHKKDVYYIYVNLSKEYIDIIEKIKLNANKYLKILEENKIPKPTKSNLDRIADLIQKYNKNIFQSYAAYLTYSHILELLQTQSVKATVAYLNELFNGNYVERKVFNEVYPILKDLEIEHPKMDKLIELVKNLTSKTIIFSQYKVQIDYIEEKLKSIGLNVAKFVGKKSMNRKMQQEIIDKFKNDEIRILISSSVGEEGLDIPNADNVIFYEPIPSAIRTIQRKGRTARFKDGRIYILVTRNTMDYYNLIASRKKEIKMYNILKNFKIGLSAGGGI